MFRALPAVPRPSWRRSLVGVIPTLALALALLIGIGALHAADTAAQTTGPAGLVVTLSATGEELDSQAVGSTAPGILVQLRLDNRTGGDLSNVRVSLPLPARTRVSDSWVGAVGPNRGTPQEQSLVWSNISLARGERSGPISVRLMPDAGSEGATVFRHASIMPEITWTQPTSGRASIPSTGLLLNGLWGEGGLRRTVLATGLTLLTRERPDSTTVSLRLAARAGPRDENEITRGGSHWLEHAFFLGTRTRDNLDVELSAVGGQNGASTGWEATDYWYVVPAESFDLALDLLSDQILHSIFPRTAFDRERLVVAEELKRRDDDPSVHSFDLFINNVFRVSPLRQHPAGTIESVLSIPIETILAYRDQRYTSGNIAIAVAGNIRHDDAVTKIERAFAELAQGQRSPRPAVPEPIQTSPLRITEGDGDQLAEIKIGWPGPGDDNEQDAPAMTILDDILGATGRRLTEEIRDRRALATAVGSDYLDFSDAGAFMLSATTEPNNTDLVIQLLLEQIQRLRAGDVTDAEVQASLRAIAGRRAIEDEPNRRQTGRAQIEVSATLESWEEYMAKLKTVSAADVRRVANKYLDPQNYTLVIVQG